MTLGRRGILGVLGMATVAGVVGCTKGEEPIRTEQPTTTPPQPSPTPTSEAPASTSEPTPGEVATRAPGDVFDPTSSLLALPDRTKLAAIALGSIVVWDSSTGKIEATVPAPQLREFTGAWSWKGRTFAVPGNDGELAVILDATGREVARIGPGLSGSFELALNHAGDRLAAVLSDRTVRVFSVPDGKELAQVAVEGWADEHAPAIRYEIDDSLEISSGQGQVPIQWWTDDGATLRNKVDDVALPYYHLRTAPLAGKFSVIRDGAAEGEFTVEVRNQLTSELTLSHRVPTVPTVVALDPLAERLAYAGSWGTAAERAVVHVMDLATGQVTDLTGGKGQVQSLAWGPGNEPTALFSFSADGGVTEWDPAAAAQVRTFDLP